MMLTASQVQALRALVEAGGELPSHVWTRGPTTITRLRKLKYVTSRSGITPDGLSKVTINSITDAGRAALASLDLIGTANGF